MPPQITVENSVGNKITIQNDLVYGSSTYLAKDHILASGTLFCDNNIELRPYITGLSPSVVITGLSGSQTWTVVSTANMRINDFIVTTGATVNAVASITAINSLTSVTVNVFSPFPTGTATGVAHYINVLVGTVGSENAEIVQAQSKTNTTITLLTNTKFAHTSGELVREVVYDKLGIYKSSTETGSYILQDTISFDLTSPYTVFLDQQGSSTDWYKVRGTSTGTSIVQASGFPYYTIGGQFATATSTSSVSQSTPAYLFNSVKSALGIDAEDEYVTDEFLLNALNEARRFHNTDVMFGKNADWRQNFNYPIRMSAGKSEYTLPTTIDYSTTNLSLLNVRLSRGTGQRPTPLMYVDKNGWNNMQIASPFVYNPSIITSGATTIVLNNTGDLPTNGIIYVAATNYTSDAMIVSYTANNKDTNTLTGVTGVTANIAANTQIWQQLSSTIPCKYTVFNGKLVLERPTPNILKGYSIMIDFYEKITDVTSSTQELPEHYADIYKHFLRFAIKRRKDANLGANDPDYAAFINACKTTYNNQDNGQYTYIIN